MAKQRSAPVKRPRPQLDRETIIDAVLRIAARPGTLAVTVRTLGHELGADPTAIYRHYADKDALIKDAIDALYGRVNVSVASASDWRTQLRTAALGALDELTAHPALGAQAGTVTTGGKHELQAVEMMLSSFGEAGLEQADTVRYYATFSSYVLAFSAAQAGALLDPDGDRRNPPTWLPDYSGVDPRRYPAVTGLQPALNRLQDREVFMTGIDIILESAAARAALGDSRTRPDDRR